jgi:methionyl-tRNA synthetase
MLLAASEGRTVEVLFVDHAKPGDRILLSGGASADSPAQIDIDAFFAMPITAENGRVMVGDAALECGGEPLATTRVSKGRVK